MTDQDLTAPDRIYINPKDAFVTHTTWSTIPFKECVVEYRRADLCTPTDERVKALEAALQTFIYETTHLSPLEDDGSHWCKISAECLEKGRAALRDMDATP